MTNMKPPQEGRNTGAPSLRGLQGRSATGLNGQASKEEVSAIWRGGWMPENISGVPAGRSVFHLTSPLIGLLASVKVRDQVSHPLPRDSRRSSNRNRHLSPSVNTSRLVGTNSVGVRVTAGVANHSFSNPWAFT